MFLLRGVESHPRSFVKAVSWRALGSIDTFVLGMIFTHGNGKIAGAIAGPVVINKIIVLSFHERLWSLVRWGHRLDAPGPEQSSEGVPLAP